MPVYFIQSGQIANNQITVLGSLAKHLHDVLRMKVGDEILLTDETGRRFRVCIRSSQHKQLLTDILESYPPQGDARITVHLGQGLPKGDKFETIIQKCTELGVDRITPLLTERTIIRWDAKRTHTRVDRWRKIAQEAAQQSSRSQIPEIDSPIRLLDFFSKPIPWDIGCVLWEGEKDLTLKSLFRNTDPQVAKPSKRISCLILIGPEGGWTLQEIEAARATGLVTVSLGERILRTETAGPALLAILQYTFGDLG